MEQQEHLGDLRRSLKRACDKLQEHTQPAPLPDDGEVIEQVLSPGGVICERQLQGQSQ
jgi:hypothetical protein